MLSPAGNTQRTLNSTSFTEPNPRTAGIQKYFNNGYLKNEIWINLKPAQMEKLGIILLDEDIQKYLDNRKLDIHCVILNLEALCDTDFHPDSSTTANMLSILKNKNIQKLIDNGSLNILTAIYLHGPAVRLLNSPVIQEKIAVRHLNAENAAHFCEADAIGFNHPRL